MATNKPKATSKPSNAGRKKKKTPATQKLLIKAIESGATNRIACDYAGISEASFYEWLNESVEFSEAIKVARGKRTVGLLERIQEIGTDGNWQALAWVIERTEPEYAKRTYDVNHSGAIALTWEAVMKDALTDGDADEDDFS